MHTEGLSRRRLLQFVGATPVAIDLLHEVREIYEAQTKVDINFHSIFDKRVEHAILVVHTSDIHLNVNSDTHAFIDPQAAGTIVDHINTEVAGIKNYVLRNYPGVTVIAIDSGDHIIHSTTGIPNWTTLEQGVKKMSKIEAAHHLTVLGNHDLYSEENKPTIEATLRNAGFVLLDSDEESASIILNNEIEIIGTPDYTIDKNKKLYTENHSNATWRKKFDGDLPKILVSHNPAVLDVIGDIVQTNTILSLHGHTHGGQVGSSLITGNILDWFALRFGLNYQSGYIGGFYQLGQTFINVNTGLGSQAGPIPQVRAICPRVDIIALLPGNQNHYEFLSSKRLRYRDG